MDYENIKPLLGVGLMAVEGNEETLKEIPHHIYEDIAMIYRTEYRRSDGVMMYVTLTDFDLERYHITEEQLHEDAMTSAYMRDEVTIRSMSQVFGLAGDMPLYVVSTGKPYGAWGIFFPGLMKVICRMIKADGYYILPSSIHEMLVLKGNYDVAQLQKMVADINATEVAPEDRLTDSIYYYDSSGFKKISVDKVGESNECGPQHKTAQTLEDDVAEGSGRYDRSDAGIYQYLRM